MKMYHNILQILNLPMNSFTIVVSSIIVLFALTIFVILLLLPYKKTRSERIETFQNKVRTRIDNILLAWAKNEKTYDEVVSSLQRILKNKRTTILMLEKFNHFAESFKGQMLKDLVVIFHATKLKNKAISILNSGKNYEKAIALRVLGNMKVNEAENIIFKQATTKNPFLRSESLVALTELKKSDMAISLTDYKNQISDWDQLLILETLKEFGSPDKEAVLAWLNSENDDIIVLGIRVIYFFNLFELLDTVVKLLDHSSSKVRWVVLYTLSINGADEYEQRLINFLDKANTEEIVLILNILTSLPESIESGKLMPFLDSDSPLVQYAALNLLYLKNAVPEKEKLNNEQLDMLAALSN